MNDGDAQSTDGARGWDLENMERMCFVFLTFGLACWYALTWLAGPIADRAHVGRTAVDAATIREAMVLFRAENPDAPCPSVKNLMAEELLGSWSRTRDGWDNAYRVSCDGRDVLVVSAGPDEEFGTGDDIY